MAGCNHAKRNLILIALVLLSFTSGAADLYKYVVYFEDKDGSSGSLEQPGEFMSEKSLERRDRYSIPVSYSDLPLSSDYLSQLEDKGFELHGESRWLNAVLIFSPDRLQLSDFEDLEFVRKVQFVSKELTGGRSSLEVESAHQVFWTVRPDLEYGVAANQIRMLNGQFLHKNGFRGEGMTIAVLDAGFINADNLEAFAELYSSNRVIATYDAVDGGTGVYEVSGHGTNVLSTMAGDIPGTYLRGYSGHLSRNSTGCELYPHPDRRRRLRTIGRGIQLCTGPGICRSNGSGPCQYLIRLYTL